MDRLGLALIYGSVRPGRFCDTVAAWVAEEIRSSGAFRLDLIDPAVDMSDRDFRRWIDAADAFVVVTPEYNHSFPGPLKTAIDRAREEWHAKPVGFVSYGGASGGLRAIEHLRGVFAELHAVGIRDSVSFPNAWERFDAQGRPLDEAGCSRALARMLAQLGWWGRALRAARAAEAFGEAA